jgi:hypothetical protein
MASTWAILTATRRHIRKDNLSAFAGGAALQAVDPDQPAAGGALTVGQSPQSSAAQLMRHTAVFAGIRQTQFREIEDSRLGVA